MAASALDGAPEIQLSQDSQGSSRSACLHDYFRDMRRVLHRGASDESRAQSDGYAAIEIVDSPGAGSFAADIPATQDSPQDPQWRLGASDSTRGLDDMDDDKLFDALNKTGGAFNLDMESQDGQSLFNTMSGAPASAAMLEAPSAAASASAPTTSLQALAIKNYCAHHNLETVTLEEILASGEGIGVWATKGMKTNARSPIGQAFGRALAAQDKWRDGYPWLPDKMKQEFRLQWATNRDFQFCRESKTVINKQARRVEDLGELLPEITIASRLGSATLKETKDMAASYVAMCVRMGPPFLQYNSWLGTTCYLYIIRLISSRCEKEWRQATEHYSEINVWETRINEQKAIKKFAHFHLRKPEAVTLEEIEQSALGVKGWAEAQVSMVLHPCSKQGNDQGGSAPPSAKKAKPSPKATALGGTTLGAAEKGAKEMVSLHCNMDLEFRTLHDLLERQSEQWKWSPSYLDKLVNFEADVKSFENSCEDDFYRKFKAAALSPQMLKALQRPLAKRTSTRSSL